MPTPSTEWPALPELLRGLREGDSEKRRLAAIALGRTAIRTREATRPRTAATIAPAAECALRGPDPTARREIAYALGQWGGDEAVVLLAGLVAPEHGTSDPDPAVRATTVRALARTGDPRTQAAIVAALDDPAHDVRVAAVAAIGRLTTAPPVHRERDNTVRSRGAVRVRGGVAKASAPTTLRGHLECARDNDSSEQVRDLAREVLSRAR